MEDGQNIDHALDKPTASLRTSCTFIPGITSEGGDATKADVGRKMSTYQLDHPRNATLYTEGWPHTGNLYCFRHRCCSGNRDCVESCGKVRTGEGKRTSVVKTG